ncbi:MAG: hypothetical protein AB1652_03430 [Bacillota bacterium]
MTAETIILAARIRKELFQLQKITGELKAILKRYKQKPVKDTTVLRALGSILHDFYSGIEKIFLQIAKEIDRSAPKAENWHRLLLEQMTLHLKNRRPQVISSDLASTLQQYLAFRHRFRNLYGFELEWGRMEDLVRSLPDTFQEFSAAINSFLNLLETADNED